MSNAFEQLESGLAMALDAVRKARNEDDWIDQAKSPLGRRMHLSVVRSGAVKGHKIGKRVLVRRRDLDAFIERHEPPRAAVEQAEMDDQHEVAEILAGIGTRPRRTRRARA